MNRTAWRMAVVEDHAETRGFIADVFTELGWQVDQYEDGAEAIRAIRGSLVDVVLLDLHIPGQHGLEVLQDIRQHAVDTEVIVITGHASVDTAVRALELDAYAYLIKPFGRHQLVSCVENAQEKIALHRLNTDLIDHLCRNQAELERAIREATEELARANARLQELAVRDGLTGLYNRRYFDERLDDEISRALRYGTVLTLVLLDIDHFKAHNDTYGHLRGDDALIILASLLQESVRRNDVVARFGGEEFAIILIEATPEDVAMICERIRVNVSEADFPAHRASQSVHLTASQGYAVCPTEGRTPHGLVECADQALYAAKSAGRNRIIPYGEMSTATRRRAHPQA